MPHHSESHIWFQSAGELEHLDSDWSSWGRHFA